MRGVIKTCLPEKQYGFIKGDDNKDYFFHYSSFRNKIDTSKICEDLYVEFEQKASPKGYSAIFIAPVHSNVTIKYITPDNFYTSKQNEIKGWNVVDRSDWLVHGSSRNSPDSAKDDMIKGALLIGANALLEVEYYKKTGSEPGTGKGTYYYTIHNFKGRAVNIGKKSPNGKYSEKDLIGINSNAELLKQKLKAKSDSAQIKRLIFWFVIFLIIFWLWTTKQDVAIFGTIIVTIIGFILSHATDYDSWLEKI